MLLPLARLGPPSFLPLDTEGRIAYRDLGPSGGRTVVLLHGGGVDGRMWGRQVDPLLARGHRVIVPDTRGHGASSTPDGPFRSHEDIATLLEHLKTGPVAAVGLSMGARIAGDLALTRPDLVGRVVLSGAGIGAHEFIDPWTLEVFTELGRLQHALDADGWVESFLRFASGPSRAADEVDTLVMDELRLMTIDVLAHHLPADPSTAGPAIEFLPDTHARAASLAVPLLTVVGALDSTDHHRFATEAVTAAPDAEQVILAGAAHYPNMERPEEFTAALLNFLDR